MAMELLDATKEMPKDEIVAFVLQCQHASGGFGGNVGHDAHLLYTLSAVQVLAIFDSLDRIDRQLKENMSPHYNSPTGLLPETSGGKLTLDFHTVRLTACHCSVAWNLLTLILLWSFSSLAKILTAGFPGAESHSGQIFCCVGALAIAGALHHVDADLLGWWLAERQVKAGGLNGRPEKLPDVCYSWWVLSALTIIDRLDWIDKEHLKQWILQCQDDQKGGIADRPGDMSDVFHTFFGIAGLSLLGYSPELLPAHKAVDPVYAMPRDVLERLGVPVW
eukprot:CAMPEP_0175858232 /NCGR_PEP_ID=MMETSP0107_2-20121207/29545_1 /TAXON_ID=195067 ORGANISM="Goniomonas pacifica, Strain CCMP1869" /NCGR_SAMPLE_ID=MMETSP0107_2 /ASSEMBLY_ACC=CAM_ASM_000203 /LENGTH=276 /DNA_ID=CAMNT_0017174637 /DNA_START=23 /DNA_END=851 /DNA_ORIENTATION=-